MTMVTRQGIVKRTHLSQFRNIRKGGLIAIILDEGDDLIVRLLVSDNRQPQANQARSASYILRWPADPGSDSAGVDGIVQKVLPAYFRSQRQIIIDTEALLAEPEEASEARGEAK